MCRSLYYTTYAIDGAYITVAATVPKNRVWMSEIS